MKKGGVYKYKSSKGSGFRIKWRNAEGKQESKTLLNVTKSEALAERRKILVAIDLGDHVAKTNLRFIDFAHTFLKTKRGSLARSTYDEYVRFFTTKNGGIVQIIGDKKLQQITTKDIIDILDIWISKGKLSSAQHYYTYLNTFFNTALKMQEIDRNPMTGIPKPRPPRPEKKAMTQEQVKKFFSVITDHTEKTFFRLALMGCLRRGELLGLRVRDIDFVAESVSIQRSYQMKNKEPIYSDVKNHTARNIALDDVTLNLIKVHLDNMQVLAENFDRNRTLDDPLFCKSNHIGLGLNARPQDPDNWNRRLKRICKQAGIETFSLHELRHSGATLLILNGVDIMTVSKRLGHADRGFTLNVYGHLSDGSQNQATEKLKSVLDS